MSAGDTEILIVLREITGAPLGYEVLLRSGIGERAADDLLDLSIMDIDTRTKFHYCSSSLCSARGRAFHHSSAHRPALLLSLILLRHLIGEIVERILNVIDLATETSDRRECHDRSCAHFCRDSPSEVRCLSDHRSHRYR